MQSWLPRRTSLSYPASTPVPKPTDTTGDNTAYDPSSQSAASHSSSRNRASLLSDAFGLRKKIGSVSRKKPAFNSLSSAANLVPEVIEINACNNTTVTSSVGGATAHRDYEHEERERLRDVAAQSIGLDPELLHHLFRSESCPSLDSPQPPPQPAPIPPFPSTLAALRPFTELSSTLPKFTPPSSLLVYALAKQWKPRILVLTAHSPSQKTHVHLFKDSSKDDKEVERLEITEASVVFVAEEEVGGRGNVVKLAGKDVSAKKSGSTAEETLHTMWFLQITDPAESQRWIAAIKNAVLSQRAVRAGLDIPAQSLNGGNEPKGDIDVMLSMHLQGLLTARQTKSSASPSPPPSLRSLKINVPSSPSSTSAVKGIFSGRPRSPSVGGSSTSACLPANADESFGVAGTSLLSMLRTKSSVDSSSSPSHSLPLLLPHPPVQGSPAPSLRSINAPVIITASDLKISKERDAPESLAVIPEPSSSNSPPGSNTPPTPSLLPQGTLTLSLLPPPRKSKHIPVSIPSEPLGMYKQANNNRSVAGNFGISSGSSGDVTPRETSPVSPGSSSLYSGGQSGPFSQNSGFEMQSSFVGNEHDGGQSDELAPTLFGNGILPSPRSGSVPSDRLSRGVAITKRWSRQGVPLPKRLTPPSGPPPSIPPTLENNTRDSIESNVSIPVTHANATTHPSPSSSNSQSQSKFSSRSGSSISPTFWKRTSGSSAYSVSSTGTSSSRGRSQIPVFFRGESFPSSTGSFISRGTSARPMSLSVSVSSPAGHVGAAKRRSMPPPRPAPNFAPPPAPVIQESVSEHAPSMFAPRKSLRSSVARRALRLSLTSPKPPPSSALPPRPDEVVFTPGHRRSSSAGGTLDLHPASAPSSRPSSALSRNSSSMDPTSPPSRSLSFRQRLRILSTPPTSPPVQSPSFSTPTLQISTLDLSDDNDDDDLPTPYFQSPHPFGLGEHIMATQNDPSFLQLSSPVTPAASKPSSRSHFRSMPPLPSTTDGLRTPPIEPDRDFIALSPPPRRGSKPHIITMKRPEKLEMEKTGPATHQEENKVVPLPQRGSVVSLGFVTTP